MSWQRIHAADGRYLKFLGFSILEGAGGAELKQERVLSWLRQEPSQRYGPGVRRCGVWKQFEAEKAAQAAKKKDA